MLAGMMPNYLTFALVLPLCGLTGLTLITSANALVQMSTDVAVRGRVMALYLAIFMGGTPIGSPLLGWVAERFGARWTLIGGGALTVLGTLLATAVFARSQQIGLGRTAAPSSHSSSGDPSSGDYSSVA
jgi:MFS family permease